MKIDTYKYPESSFLSIEKDMGILINLMLKNENLKKLLYHNTNKCLSYPKLTEDETISLIGNNIKMVPKFKIDETIENYVLINFDSFTPNANNTEFRDNIIVIDILCHYDQWQLNDFQLRPYRIAAEIDTILNNCRLSGIGKPQFARADRLSMGDEFGGLTLIYDVIHGEEDKKNSPNPMTEAELIANFNKMFNE